MIYSDIRLGVNIDHVATLRNARGTVYPDPVHAAAIAELAGADGLTVHLREDRRHIQERDLFLLKETTSIPINLEMALTDEMLTLAEKLRPAYVCMVPEKREELTTEGGLDVVKHQQQVATTIEHLTGLGIQVSLFIDPDQAQIEAAKKAQAPLVEVHTGEYADAKSPKDTSAALRRVYEAVQYADGLGFTVNAGHGLHYNNVGPIASMLAIYELNIGHSIISRSLFDGLRSAIVNMKQLMLEARRSALLPGGEWLGTSTK